MTDLHFCNFCDQSVPLAKLDNGEAIRHGGRVICPTCCDALSMATRGDGGAKWKGLAIFALLVGLLGWLGVGFLFLEQSKLRSDNTTNLNNVVVELAAAISNQEDRLEDHAYYSQGQFDTLKETTQQGFSTALNDIAGLDKSLAAVRIQVERLEGLADGQTSLELETRALRTQLQISEDGMREIRKGLEFLRDGFADLERKMVVATATPAQESGFSDEVQSLLNALKADDPLTRVAALEKLGQHQDPALIPYVEPMLQDTYEMNRFYAAFTLGEWQAMASVPALIESLNDDFAFVADAVNKALLNISKEDMGFDSKGSDSDKAKAISRWQDWWKKNASE